MFFLKEGLSNKISYHKKEVAFLAGKQGFLADFVRVFRITFEFMKGFVKFYNVGPAVTVFGSARFGENNKYYEFARLLGRSLAKRGYAVLTGGGPGIMEAANRGAFEANGKTIGANIILPEEQLPNKFVNKLVTFYYFFVRKVILLKYSFAYVFLPGGFGTLDELAESITLIQTKKLLQFPIILVGKEYWSGLIDWIKTTLVSNHAIDDEDVSILHITDDLEEVLKTIDLTAKLFNITKNN